MDAPSIPPRFPCWVKAVYSWGGETKHDLGFMEGDYIECLNAGDGSWWTGRLKRDRRMIGQFPSNFVKVLDQDSIPASRNASPLPIQKPDMTRSSSNTPPGSTAPSLSSPQKPRTWRKPFSAHTAGQTPGSPLAQAQPKPTPAKSFKPRPYSSMKKPELNVTTPKPQCYKPPSPKIPNPVPRGASYRRETTDSALSSRVPSPAPLPQSPQAPYHSRPVSPLPVADRDSSPPPPPPPTHRVAYTRPSSPAHEDMHPNHLESALHPPRTPSPAPSHHTGMTPSPLRDAMNDVMCSLDGMRMHNRETPPDDEETPQPVDIWSPDAFNEIHNKYSRSTRPNTSVGFSDGLDYQNGNGYFDQNHHAASEVDDQPDHLRDYVQRMEHRLREMQSDDGQDEDEHPPMPPPKKTYTAYNPSKATSQSAASSSYEWQISSVGSHAPSSMSRGPSRRGLSHRKSAFELGKERLARTFTTRSNGTEVSSAAHSSATSNSNSTQITSPSLMSGHSAGEFSATSAGSLARRHFGKHGSVTRPKSAAGLHPGGDSLSGVSCHSSHNSNARAVMSNGSEASDPLEHGGGLLGGLAAPTPKKRSFFKKLMDQVQTSTASARSSMNQKDLQSPRPKSALGRGVTSISGEISSRSNAESMGFGGSTGNNSGGVDWIQMRRDVNRSNSLSQNERRDRVERCQMMDIPVMRPTQDLNDTVEGDESADGYAVTDPTDFQACQLALVDKSARFVNSLPAVVNAASLAQTYLCRPYKSDVQRLRAIFTWVSERVSWEDDFEGKVDPRRVIQSRRGCSEEIAVLVRDMCMAAGHHAEVVRGYLKSPGEVFLAHDFHEAPARPNHWWNVVIADGEWRIMDCSLANPTNPHRSAFSAAGSQVAESWWFLARPVDVCYTHVPVLPEQQHVITPLAHNILMSLPVACPPFFKYGLQMFDYNTSLLHLEGLDMAQIQLSVPDDVECVAEVEAHAFAHDTDGDLFESGEIERKRALAQADFVNFPVSENGTPPFKRYTIKAVLPSHEKTSSQAVLRVFAGRRGLMHSIHSNPHSLALALPLIHDGGTNPPYDFFVRHPTPHALRHEVYVVSPQCKKLAVSNTFVFSVRQHPASPNMSGAAAIETSIARSRPGSPNSMAGGRAGSSLAIARPSSALSMQSMSASGSGYSNPSASGSDQSRNASHRDSDSQKPAKLAIQSPSGKILRMSRKAETIGGGGRKSSPVKGGKEDGDGSAVERVGSTWETIIKIGERGVWRGLVLADRSARWCVFGEWEAV